MFILAETPSNSFWRMKASPAINGGGSTPTKKA
jgi:hypothetical protein